MHDDYSVPSAPILSGPGGADPLRIWLADDDEEDRQLFVSAMDDAGHRPAIAHYANGKVLMDALMDAKDDSLPHLILLDLNMPLKNGSECLGEIRANDRLRGIPVVIYSTTRNEELIDDLYGKDADYYISKPSSYAGLMTMAHQVCSMPWRGHSKPAKSEFVLISGK